PTWNASVCAGDIGRLQFSIGRGGATSGLGLALKDVALRGVVARGAGRARGAAPAGAAAPARGAAPGAAGGRGGTAAAPAQQPIVLSRNGKDFTMTVNATTVRAGTEIRVKTERPEVSFSLTEMAKDSWVV